MLTPREEEVLALLGLGLSNPAIAQRLFISRKTASHHVCNILARLGLHHRAEVAAYVAEHAGRHGLSEPFPATAPRPSIKRSNPGRL